MSFYIMSSSSTSATEQHEEKRVSSGVKHKWFPLLVLAALAVWITSLFLRDFTRDMRIAFTVLSTILACLLLLVWAALFMVKSYFAKLVVLVAPIAVVAISAATFLHFYRLKWDGDTAIIGFESRATLVHDRQLEIPETEAAADDWQTTPNDYPCFLGPNHNGEITTITLETDWEKHPPRELWRTKVGAGWSGFAIVGNYAITQEQRSDFEMVVCRNLHTGDIVWTHKDKIRFDPSSVNGSLGGPGPRATPLVVDGKIYTHGATGLLNCLDAKSGKRIWMRDTVQENGGECILWGKSGSPILVKENIIISVGAPNGKSLIAYNAKTGDVAWSAGSRQSSYATPVQMTLADVPHIVCVNQNFVTGHHAFTGKQLWEHPWKGDSGADATNTNSTFAGTSRVLLSKGYGVASELLKISNSENGTYQVKRLWKKGVMKTKMTNPIIHNGYVYGLDGNILQCVELDSGKKMWKKGRVGHGQVLLIGNVLLCTTELTGEVWLVEASSKKYHRLARLKVLQSEGKMWNYPAIAGKYLIVRNAEEAVCYELPLKE